MAYTTHTIQLLSIRLTSPCGIVISSATYFSPSQSRKPPRPHSDQGRRSHSEATAGSAPARLRCSEDCQGLRCGAAQIVAVIPLPCPPPCPRRREADRLQLLGSAGSFAGRGSAITPIHHLPRAAPPTLLLGALGASAVCFVPCLIRSKAFRGREPGDESRLTASALSARI